MRATAPATVARAEGNRIALQGDTLAAGRFGTGDYHVLLPDGRRLRITANGPGWVETDPAPGPGTPAGSALVVQIRLQQPEVDPQPMHRLRGLRARVPGARPPGHPGDGRERVARSRTTA